MFKTFFIRLNDINYKDSLLIQEQLQNRLILENSNIQYILFVNYNEHIYTRGKNGNKNNLLISKKVREKLSINLFETDRGGDITYHGPGQIVVYPIMNLKLLKYGIKQYVFQIEEIIKNFLIELGIVSNSLEGKPGVWVEERKIASIGINIKKFITKHGFSINLNNNLSYFKNINTCGYKNLQVTSIENELGINIDPGICYERLSFYLKSFFNLEIIESEANEIVDNSLKKSL